MRRPSEIDSVACTVRPRSAGAFAPEAKLKPVFQPWVIVPAPLADKRCTASATVLMPRSWSVSELSTVTGDGASVLVRRRIEPVTTIVSSVEVAPSSAGASCAKAGAETTETPRTDRKSDGKGKRVSVRVDVG